MPIASSANTWRDGIPGWVPSLIDIGLIVIDLALRARQPKGTVPRA
jgi:hypothetical protein